MTCNINTIDGRDEHVPISSSLQVYSDHPHSLTCHSESILGKKKEFHEER